MQAHGLCLVEYPTEGGARPNRSGWTVELAEKQDRIFEGQLTAGLGQYPNGSIRVARVPAGELHVVVELVIGIPAEHDVTESEATVEGREELVL